MSRPRAALLACLQSFSTVPLPRPCCGTGAMQKLRFVCTKQMTKAVCQKKCFKKHEMEVGVFAAPSQQLAQLPLAAGWLSRMLPPQLIQLVCPASQLHH